MFEIGICGHFGIGKNLLNGQTVKTKIVTKELEKKLGMKVIKKIDTCDWRKNPFKLFLESFLLIKNCKNVLIFPAHNGIKIFVPLFSVFNFLLKRKLHYIVIGGWLYNYLQEKKYLIKYLKKYKGIYVETKGMKLNLEKLGFENIFIMKNFKKLEQIKIEEKKNYKEPIFKLCTFSRVNKNKGIEDAIQVVNEINKKNERIICSLDIYGEVEKEYKDRFNKLLHSCESYINYRGVIDSELTSRILKNYYLLLFPTRYYTEGIPGTVIDAFSSGLPILFSKWENYMDVLEDPKLSKGYNFLDIIDFEAKLEYLLLNPDIVQKMSFKCFQEAKKYKSGEVIKVLINNF